MTRKKSPATESIPSVMPLQQELPLLNKNFSWERFEEFSRAFVGRRPGVRRVSSYGIRGSKQSGIDFPAEMASGETWSFQCRQVKAFSKTQFEATVRETTYEASRHIVLLACPVGTLVRDAERELANWEVWDVTDISRMVRELRAEEQRALVSAHFGRYVQEAFLGVKGFAAFRSWADHFAPYLRDGRLFHHRTPFVGREETLAKLDEFVGSPTQVVIVLSGRGGSGKSKVLQKFGEKHLAKHENTRLLYADENTEFSAETLQDIPAEPLIIVVDDAHRREDLGQLLSVVARWQHPIKLVLAIRSEGRERIATLVANSAIDAAEVAWLPDLTELSRELGEKLAENALGGDLKHLGDRLYAVTWDCPLVTIVGAELLRRKQLPPELLERDDDFRRAVLDRFTSAALGDLGVTLDHGLAAKVLELVSGLHPIAPGDPKFLKAAAEFLGADQTHLVRTLDGLEEAGLLLRRGYRVRIVPDVLGDHLLARACLTSKGSSTGYVDRLLDTFAYVAFDRLLANVAELDWRIRVTSDSGTRLLDRIWQIYEQEFKAGSNTTQAGLLRMLKDAAVFQGNRVLGLVEYAMDHPAESPEPDDVPSIYLSGREQVVHVLAELADRCAHGGQIRRAANVLWRLGQDDARPLNQFPSHPIRLLQELSGYDSYKPLNVNSEMLAAAEGWLREPDAHVHVHSPLEIATPLLAKTGLDRSSDGISIRFRPFSVSASNTRPLRQRAVELARSLALGTDLKVALQAVEMLGAGLADPIGYFSQIVSDQEKSSWTAEQLEILEVFEELARRTDMPLLQLAVAEAVLWTAHRGHSVELKAAAERVRVSIQDAFELRMLRAMTHPWGIEFDLDSDRDIHEAEQRRVERMKSAADELAVAMTTGDELVAYLQERIRGCLSAGVNVDPGYLIGLLAERHPRLAAEAAEEIVAVPGHPMEFMTGHFLLGVRPSDPAKAGKLAHAAVEGGSRPALAAIAFLYGYRGWLEGAPSTDDVAILKGLLQSKHNEIRAMATTGLRSLKDHHPAAAKRFVLEINVGSGSAVGEAFAELLDPDHALFQSMSNNDLVHLVAQIEDLENLDGYHLRRFLRAIASAIPMTLLEMLIRRIDLVAKQGFRATYEALPSHPAFDPVWGVIAPSARRELLLRVREEALQLTWARNVDVPHLFADIAGDWVEAADLLEEWIQTGDATRVSAAVRLFGGAPEDYIFENVDAVKRCLDAAGKVGENAVRQLRGAYWASVHSGVKSGQVLQPMDRDVHIRNRSREIAGELAEGSLARRFYEDLAVETISMMEHQRKTEEELVEGPLP
jgi:hypothetical protein